MSPDRKSFTIDGHPILIEAYFRNIHHVIELAEKQLLVVLRGCPIDDIDEVIKKTLDLSDTTALARDRPREDEEGYSFLTDPENPFHCFKFRLAKHFLADDNNEFAVPQLGSEVWKAREYF
jgi:hypothetical protein